MTGAEKGGLNNSVSGLARFHLSVITVFTFPAPAAFNFPSHTLVLNIAQYYMNMGFFGPILDVSIILISRVFVICNIL